MKVVRQHGPGGPEALRVDEVEPPRPGPGELLVAVGAAGVSLPQVRAGRAASGPWPVAPGGEVAGRVTAVGAEVEGWAVGDHVVSIAFAGAYAESAVVPAVFTSRVPDEVTDVQAVALLRNGHVALGALRRGSLDATDTVLVTAAAGGVGHLAVQLARALGAARVVAAVGDPAKAAFLEEIGADEVVGYGDAAAPWTTAVDLALDGAGGAALARALDALVPFGRLVTYSASGGTVEVNDLRTASRSILGFAVGHLAQRWPERYAADADDLWRLLRDGRVTPAVHATLPLTDAGEAHRLLEQRRNLGKVVLVPDR